MDPDFEYRIARLEVQVRQILQHLGLPADGAAGAGFDASPMPGAVPGPAGYGPSAPVPPEIAAALQSGKMIQAIKIYRGLTGMGLKEAKTAVEAMARDMGVRY
jgi:ribosomal protein L7/L12